VINAVVKMLKNNHNFYGDTISKRRNIMKMKGLKIAFVGLVLSLSSFANAGLIVNIVETGGNVEASYSGSINLDSTQGIAALVGAAPAFNGFASSVGGLAFTDGVTDVYAIDIASWTPFGTTSLGDWDVSTGDAIALFTNPFLGLASGYTSGDMLSGTATKFNVTLADVGFDMGSFVSTISNNNVSDTVTINISRENSPMPVSTPSSLAIYLLAIAGVVLVRLKRS
jgi:hypothetical protein